MMNKPTVLELCAGAGGMALGYERAGFEHSGLIDKNHVACRTLRHNRPAWPVLRADLTKLTPNDFYKYYGSTVIHASTPCQPFSYAGNMEGLADTRGTLFENVLGAVLLIKPAYVVLENVQGLVTHDKHRTFNTMMGWLRASGYTPTAKVLNSIKFKVAQKRKRLFVVARRNDLPDVFVWPMGGGSGLTLKHALKNVPDSPGYEYSEERRIALLHVPPGGNWRDMPTEVARAYMGYDYGRGGGGSTQLGRRLSWDSPAPTILCQPNGKRTERCHPDETRPLRVRENARIQGFPDEWEFTGGVNSQYRQIGNAVPPPLAEAVASALMNALRKS